MDCLSDELLATLAEGRVPTGEADAAWAHLAGCDRCARLFDEVSAQVLDARTSTPADEGFGRYELVRCLGQGGMGTVYLAFDPLLRRRIALKVVAHSDAGALTRASVLREAKALARVNDPHVTTIHDVGVVGTSVYFAMEYVDGASLADWLRERPRAWREVAEVFLEAGEGLAAVHRARLVHRDFKPSNVLLGRGGRVKVTDFGVAREWGAAALPLGEVVAPVPAGPRAGTFTRKGLVAGTLGYIPPEQLVGGAVSAAGDQFSFCVALYEALEGRLPFAGVTTLEYDEALRGGPPGFTRDAPAWLRHLVLRGLALAPEARFPTLEALLAVLRFELHGRRARRRRWLRGAAVVLLLGAPAGLVALGHWRDARACEARLGALGGSFSGLWDAARRAACAAPDEKAVACLAAWRRAVSDATAFIGADAARAMFSREVEAALGTPARCLAAASPAGLPLAGDALEARLALATREPTRARAKATSAVEGARRAGARAELVRALMVLAAVEPIEAARPLLHEARLIALEAGEAELVVRAAVAEAPLLESPDARHDMLALAAAFAERLGPGAFALELGRARALVEEANGKPDAAMVQWAAVRAASNPSALESFEARRHLVTLLRAKGQLEEASALVQTLVRDERAALGAHHPDVAADDAMAR